MSDDDAKILRRGDLRTLAAIVGATLVVAAAWFTSRSDVARLSDRLDSLSGDFKDLRAEIDARATKRDALQVSTDAKIEVTRGKIEAIERSLSKIEGKLGIGVGGDK